MPRRPQHTGLQPLEPRLLLAANPTVLEQLSLEYINRFRAGPRADLLRMVDQASLATNQATSPNADINSALNFFDTQGTVLDTQFTGLSTAQPLAWNDALNTAAYDHTLLLKQNDSQSHREPGEDPLSIRVPNAGYTGWSALAENVYSYAEDMWHAHAGFIIDWGNTPTGIQDPPGHRNNLLSDNYREIGIAVLADNNNATAVGPYLTTQDLGNRSSILNQGWLLGVTIDDTDADNFYDIGEQLSGVAVQAVGRAAQGTFNTTSEPAGGYQLLLPNGIYDVTYTGGGLSAPVTTTVTIAGKNVKHDAINPAPAPEIAVTDNSGKTDNLHAGYTATLVGETNTGVTITLSNTGNDTLNLTNIRLAWFAQAEFDWRLIDHNDQPVAGNAHTIAAGETAQFEIDFTPVQPGKRLANLIFDTNDLTDNEQRIRVRLSGEGDLGGNTLNTAADLGSYDTGDLGTTVRRTDLLSRIDTADLFRIDLLTAATLDAKINNLAADTDLQLLDASGNILVNKRRPGLVTERLVENLAAGTYYLRVLTGLGVRDTTYRLVATVS